MKTIKIVTRIFIETYKNNSVVNFLNTFANVVEAGKIESNIDWSKTSTWTVPAINAFCLNKLANAFIKNYDNEVKITKVELFDPATHELLSEVAA